MESRTFNTSCPFCSAPYENIGVALAGRKARCVRCQKSFVLRPQDNGEIPERQSSSQSKSTEDNSTASIGDFDNHITLDRSSSKSFDLLEDSPESPSLEKHDQAETIGTRSAYSEFEDEFQDLSFKDFARQFPDPLPKGIWRPGEILLDGLCQVLPLSHDKLYAEGGVGYVQRVRRKDWNIDLIVKSPKPGSVKTETGKELCRALLHCKLRFYFAVSRIEPTHPGQREGALWAGDRALLRGAV